MNAHARLAPDRDPVDVIAMALARALARQHHAEALAAASEGNNDAHRDLRPLLQPAPER
jgi:hypothetical protein